MENPIIARYRWTVDELIAAQRCHARHNCRPIFRVGMYVIAIMALFAGVITIVEGRSPILGWSLTVGTMYFIFVRPFDVQLWTKYRFSKRPDKNTEIEWQLTPEEILVITPQSQSALRWEVFAKAVHSPSGLLFYQTEQLFYWLPRPAFANDADFEHVSEWAKTKLPKFYIVS